MIKPVIQTWSSILSNLRSAAALWAVLFLFVGCINEDLSDCGVDYQVKYHLKLVTNLQSEIEQEMTSPEEIALGQAMNQTFERVFQEYAQDIDLSFYKEGMSLEHHESTLMDGATATYSVYLPQHNYMHLAIANQQVEKEVTRDHLYEIANHGLHVDANDTVQSQQIGLFTGRLPMRVEDRDQIFNVSLYPVNAAEALVLNLNNQPVQAVKVYVKDLATSYYVRDSLYTFDRAIVMTQQKLEAEVGQLRCYYGVGFPSRQAPAEKPAASLKAEDQDVAQGALWEMHVYVTMSNGKTTQNRLYVKTPLRPGQLKIIKAKIDEEGKLIPADNEVGVGVTLDWKPGGEFEQDLD